MDQHSRIIDRSYVGEILQRMYVSQLDPSVSLVLDRGYFYLVIADKRIALEGTSIEEAVTHMALRVGKEFPTSSFAEWWNNSFV
jgi:hypothetical protein